MPSKKKDFDYQLDLTPFISLLSVCICFLLLTVAWFQVGSLTVKQAMGEGASEQKKDKKASLWVYIKTQSQIEVRLKRGDKALSQKFIEVSKISESAEDRFNFKAFEDHVKDLKKQQEDLDEAFIFPEAQVLYEDIVKIMDAMRKVNIFNMGLSPI